MSLRNSEVIVVGGGFAGSALSISLARAGAVPSQDRAALAC